MFEISHEKFSGPLDLLLQLIEEQELDITEVSLAEVAESYLKLINEKPVPPEELADFLVIATRLLYIKSRAILPEVVMVEEEGGDLAAQLKMYREFVEASKYLDELVKKKTVSFARNKPIIKRAEFAPPTKLKVGAIEQTLQALIKRLEPFLSLQRASVERIISVQERIRNIHDAVLNRAKLSFSQITGSKASKVELITSFLAILELVKQRIVSVSQQNMFEDINIKRID